MEGSAVGVELRDSGLAVVGGGGVCDYRSVEECVWEAEAGYYRSVPAELDTDYWIVELYDLYAGES
jgi:hypothetical protein